MHSKDSGDDDDYDFSITEREIQYGMSFFVKLITM